MTTYEKRMTQVLRDYGFKLEGSTILNWSTMYRSWEVWGTARNLFSACERLIPIIGEEFRQEFRNIGADKPRVKLPPMPKMPVAPKPVNKKRTAMQEFVRRIEPSPTNRL